MSARLSKGRKLTRSPEVQAGASPLNGVVPPEHSRFKPGQSGNPAGRKTAGAYVQEWINSMADWSVDRLKAVLADESAPASKVAAARVWFHAASQQTNAAGSPIAGAEFDRIMDRTMGKPNQAVDLTSGGEGLTFALVVAKPNGADHSN